MLHIFTKQKKIIFLCFGMVCLFTLLSFLPSVLSNHYVPEKKLTSLPIQVGTTTDEIVFIPSYISTPDIVKGVYITSWTASDETLRNKIVNLIDETELNTIVIDIKDYSGKLVFPVSSKELLSYGSEAIRVKDMQDFVELLHNKGIYVIGRVAVFQDEYFVKFRPDLAVKNKSGDLVWKDRKGISWIDPGSREYWDYIVLLSKESRKIGFDEINFDYIRFPSDGNMQDISYPWSSTTPKTKVMKEFFEYLHESLLDSGLATSADLFGMTTTAKDDMGIGQLLEDALPYFDYISPMVYPSHYPSTFMNFKDPEAHPYEVIRYVMESAVIRAEQASTTREKLRPWLQDFGLRMTYGLEEVRAQIKATNDAGLSSWLLWSASNKYTRGALNKD